MKLNLLLSTFILLNCAYGIEQVYENMDFYAERALDINSSATALICGAESASLFFEPDRLSSVGLDLFEQETSDDEVETIEELFLYIKDARLPDGNIKIRPRAPRYLYSPKWGWIDMKHFLAAAHYTMKSKMSWAVLLKGEMTEIEQVETNPHSSFSYEDLISNSLGAYFPSYLKEKQIEGQTEQEVLIQFLEEIGAVDNPLNVAPNRDLIPEVENYKTPPTWMNFEYKPLFVDETIPLNDTDKAAQKFINRFETWGSMVDKLNRIYGDD